MRINEAAGDKISGILSAVCAARLAFSIINIDTICDDLMSHYLPIIYTFLAVSVA